MVSIFIDVHGGMFNFFLAASMILTRSSPLLTLTLLFILCFDWQLCIGLLHGWLLL